ncbi:hypothetical protein DWB78_15380 [Halopelagius longus]|uniref:TOBE domain-containing protein n=1 Tax=Halopelagius longus TaxID=1236180 RepID=A0A370IH44_9EURY|nr:hypothetical protein DWB78_15380 [Halopelagius longus]
MVHLTLGEGDEELLAQVPGSRHFDHGDTIGVAIDPDRIHLFDETEDAVYNPPLHSEQQVKQLR